MRTIEQERAMRIVLTTLVTGVWGMALAIAQAATSPEAVPKIINQITEIKYANDASKAVQLLEQLESFDWWSLGGGRGPTDRVSLSMTVLVATREFMPWDVRPSEVPASQSRTLQEWLRADPQSAVAMLAMLGNADALPRWIALEKLRVVGTTDAVVLDKVQQIAASDDRLGIRRQSARNVEGSEHVFSAPLRELASEVLKMSGRTVPLVDYDELSREGLRWLGENYLKRDGAIPRQGLEAALRQLTPKTPEIAAAQSGFSQTTPPAAVLALFERLARAEFAVTAPGSRLFGKPNGAFWPD